MIKSVLRAVGIYRPSIDDAMIIIREKEQRTLTQDRSDFVEIIHPDGYKSRHKLLITILNANTFNYKRDRLDYWNYLEGAVKDSLPGKLYRVCISNHLYRI